MPALIGMIDMPLTEVVVTIPSDSHERMSLIKTNGNAIENLVCANAKIVTRSAENKYMGASRKNRLLYNAYVSSLPFEAIALDQYRKLVIIKNRITDSPPRCL